MEVGLLADKPDIKLLMVGNLLSGAGYAPSTCEILAAKMRESGFDVLAVSKYPGRFARLFDMLWSAYRWRHRYDLAYVEVYSGLAFVWAEAVCKLLLLLKKPFVLSLHGGNLPEFSRRHPRRVSRLLASAKAVVAPSGYLREKLKVCRDDILIIPNGLDVTPYSFRHRDKPSPSLVWLRAFHKIYNPKMAVEVVSRLLSDFPDLHLQMIGPDKDGSLDKVRKLVEEKEVSRHIAFPGRIEKPEVPLRLNEGDIFINTTNVDNTPVSVIEAMACGMCVVSTDVGGLPFLLEHEVDALLVPKEDGLAMAAAVRRLLTEPGLAASLSHNARTKVEHFDWLHNLPKWIRLFINILNEDGCGATR